MFNSYKSAGLFLTLLIFTFVLGFNLLTTRKLNKQVWKCNFIINKIILQISEQFALVTEDYSILKKQLTKCESEQSQWTSKDKVMKKLASCRQDMDVKKAKLSSLQELDIQTKTSLSKCRMNLKSRDQTPDNDEAASLKKKKTNTKIIKHR